MGKERGSRHVSSPEGLFLCRLIAWARKVSFCLSPPELGISHLHPQASRLLQHPHQSTTPHRLLCQPAAQSRKWPPLATKAPSQAQHSIALHFSPSSLSHGSPQKGFIWASRRPRAGGLSQAGGLLYAAQRGRKRKAGGHSAEGKRELPITSRLTACNYDRENAL